VRAFTTSTLILVVFASRCIACSVFPPEVHVGSDFRVQVRDRGLPVKGLRLEISRGPTGGKREVTDNDGFALFRNVRSGSYTLHADHDVGIWDRVDVDVRPDGPAEITVPLRWPSVAPVAVRSLKGTLHSPDYLPGQPQPRLSLDLLEGMSGKVLRSGRTTESGAFELDNPVPGIYFIRLNPSGLKDWAGEQITGLIAVAVEPGAPADHLDLDLAWSSCGLAYSDRSGCPKSELQIAQFRGRVLDCCGAAIAQAEVFLFYPGGTQIERIRSDIRGEFASPRELKGAYELVVRSPGFTALRATVHAEAKVPGRSTLAVELGVGGTCSEVHVP